MGLLAFSVIVGVFVLGIRQVDFYFCFIGSILFVIFSMIMEPQKVQMVRETSRSLFGYVLSIFILFSMGLLRSDVGVVQPSWWESFYFSVVTFTTLGYGDYLPIGINRVWAMLESFIGVFIWPLFLVGLTRIYLRGGKVNISTVIDPGGRIA